ncbi:sugar ABC transporter permease [Chloroflexi bacterium TSY]|nr:sugar ABC transporter permease [Chloroflexi bacterium TSY]
MARRKALMGYLFLLPTILGILIFIAGPVLVSFGLSFFKWSVLKPPAFIGTAHFERMFGDTRVAISFLNTLKFVLVAISIQIALSLGLALAISGRMATGFRYYFRTAFFLPYLMSGAATAIVLSYMLNKEFGAVNYYLGFLGVPRIPWMTSSSVVLYTIVLAYVWQHMGFTLILFIGGLNNISPEILDAADVDGATGWHRFWHITLPMLSPIMLFAAVVGVIGGLQIFDQPYVMTRGGPGDATRTAVMVLYESAFKNMEVGYGSAIAVLLFIAIMIVTAIQFWLSRRWVFYQ